MPVSGLVITICEETRLREDVIGDLSQHPQMTMGEMEGNRLAVLLDTPTRADDKASLKWLESLPGVMMVEVAFVGFEQNTEGVTIPAIGPQVALNSQNAEIQRDGPNDGC